MVNKREKNIGNNIFRLIGMFPITGMCPKSVDMFLTNRQNVDMFLDAILRTGSGRWTSFRLPAGGMNQQFHFFVPRFGCGFDVGTTIQDFMG